MLTLFDETMPPQPIDLALFAVVPRPIGQWLSWLLAAFLGFLALTLGMHLMAIYAQRTRPLTQTRTYLRLTIPASVPAKPADAVTLLKSLHGMVVAGTPMQPTAAPLMLCWTAWPERKIQQAISVAGQATTVTSLLKRLQGVASGTKVVTRTDPLLAALTPGRFLCAAEVATVAGADLPIGIVGRESTLLSALLPALAPQTGVLLTSARLIQEPIPDRRWRLRVLALVEQLKLDTSAEEQAALKAKAAGPAFRSRLLLLAVADVPQAGAAQVQTMGAAFAASAQAIGMTTQRLQVGNIQVLPAIVPARAPFPAMQRQLGGMTGILVALLLLGWLWRLGMVLLLPLLLVLLILPLPILILGAIWRRRTGADLPQRHAAILAGVLPPRNPEVVPIWWPWLGRTS